MRGIGHFGDYVPATARSYIQTTGAVEAAPNATAGMRGLGEMFGPMQTQWVEGIQNEYIVAAGALVLLLVVMK